jgi:hypothetical protein
MPVILPPSLDPAAPPLNSGAQFSTLINEISPFVPECPTPIIGSYVRKVVIDLCTQTGAWKVFADPVTLTTLVGAYSFALPSSVFSAEVVWMEKPTLARADSTSVKDLDIFTLANFQSSFTPWPDTNRLGEPAVLTQMSPQIFMVHPLPDTTTTYTINMTLVLRPTVGASQWDSSLSNEFRDTIVHGALFFLLGMPKRKWRDSQLSNIHGRQWKDKVNTMRARVNKSFTNQSLMVSQRPWA